MRLCGLLVVLVFGACTDFVEKSKKTFSKEYSCPLDRVTSKLRVDLSSEDLTFGYRSKTEPPADIKYDPARLAMWEAKEKKDNPPRPPTNNVFEVSGCSEKAFYICRPGTSCNKVIEFRLPPSERSTPRLPLDDLQEINIPPRPQ